jgi:hypothetical protein
MLIVAFALDGPWTWARLTRRRLRQVPFLLGASDGEGLFSPDE